MGLRELMRLMGVGPAHRQSFRRMVKDLVRQGDLIQLKNGKIGLPGGPMTVTGRLQGHRDGYAFVLPDREGEQDVFVRRQNMADAMHGDRVAAQIERTTGGRRGDRREGRIVKVLERANTRLVGRFETDRASSGRFGFVIPTDSRLFHDIYVSRDYWGEAKDGQLVLAEIVTYPTAQRNPEARILQVLGEAGDARLDTDVIIEEFHLTREFPHDVETEAGKVPERVPLSAHKGRKDLRHLRTVTIDGERARDFDDAVSIERLPRGHFRLWVHIADVGHYVPWGTPLDDEALRRGTSVYFPDRVLPMFPERLSNGICSLNPNEDRLTLTAEMEFDGNGRKVGYDLYESVIHSARRMTYTDVKRILADRDPEKLREYAPLVEDFRLMEELCLRLIDQRHHLGSIDFDLPEPELILDLQGQTTDILKQERTIAHRIIEEFMLSANRTVAEDLTERGIPTLYRIHETPDAIKMQEFLEFLEGLSVSPQSLKLFQREVREGTVRPVTLRRLLDSVKDTPSERLINHVMLRSMKQARYAVAPLGHFGLAFDLYSHFTSPIRRYPDLVVHRILKERLQGKLNEKRRAWLAEQLPEIAQQTSARERIAMEAEREVVDLKKVRFMADRVGEVFDGFISGVTAFGMFVELKDLFVEGLIHVTAITDDYYVFLEKEHCLLGQRRKKRYRLADPIRVRVERVDLNNRKLDFSLAEAPPRHGKEEPRRHRRR
jgi:ribonuclease R